MELAHDLRADPLGMRLRPLTVSGRSLQVTKGDRASVMPDARPRRLIGRAQLVHRVVVGVGDVRAPVLVERLADEVEQVAVRARGQACDAQIADVSDVDRKSTRLNSSHVAISYAVFCLKKK